MASTNPMGQVVITTESQASTGTVTVTDKAGNTETFTTLAYKIDKTKPGLTFAATNPAPNGAGWNNTNATVAYTTSDNLSGVVSVVPATPLVFTDEGNNLTQTVTVTDNADNIAIFTSQVVKIDKTLPVITTTRTPANANGWNNTDVTVSFTADDSLSGVETVTDPVILSGEGADQFVTGTAVDKAGNSSTTTVQGISIDRTKPTVIIGSPIVKEYFTQESITLDFSASDALCGLDVLTGTLDGNPVSNGQVISLASMGGNHTLLVLATDKAGNSDSASVSFSVTITASLDINPGTLNLKSNSDKNAVTAYIELPAGYDAAQIDVSSIKLDVRGAIVAAQLSPTAVGDNDGDGLAELMVKFDRQAVIAALAGKSGNATMTLTGQLAGGCDLICSDTIRVINNGK